MTTELIWQHLDAPGWEHVRVISDHPAWTVFDSVLVREHGGNVLRGGYTLVTDKQWRTLELRLMLESSPGNMEGIHLLTEGDGRWTDANEQHIPELDGCLDVDIAWTPLTNSLPINRLRLEQGEKHAIRVAHISLPDLLIASVHQRYERADNSRILFSSVLQPDHVAISIDEVGFVSNFPELFSRASPS